MLPTGKVFFMAVNRITVSSLYNNGNSMLGKSRLVIRYPDDNIVSGSFLTVEANEYAIVKSRGVVLGEYGVGQYELNTSTKPLLGNLFNGTNSGAVEVFYISKAKHFVRHNGRALSSEMASLSYEVDFYFHVPDEKAALDLLTHMPIVDGKIDIEEIKEYAGPVAEQAVNQNVQLLPLEQINEHISKITETVHDRLEAYLAPFGIKLDSVKVLVYPNDALMKDLISFRAFGLSEREAVNALIAYKLAERGVLSAPNALIGEPFNIGAQALTAVSLDNKDSKS